MCMHKVSILNVKEKKSKKNERKRKNLKHIIIYKYHHHVGMVYF